MSLDEEVQTSIPVKAMKELVSNGEASYVGQPPQQNQYSIVNSRGLYMHRGGQYELIQTNKGEQK